MKLNSLGFVPVIVLVAVLGLVAFVLISGTASFKSSLNASLYAKKDSSAKSYFNTGDTNGDGKVDILDYNLLVTKFNVNSYNNADFNGDNKVNILDYNLLIQTYGRAYIGSALTTATMIEGVAKCTDHDITKWHDLVKRDASGNIICTYGHEHHDNPDSVDDIFGAPGAWFGAAGQSISYPWQTFAFTTDPNVNLQFPTPPTDPAKMENALKHNGYKWVVRRDVPCIPFNPAPNDGCYRAMRAEFHTLGTTADTVVRFHSFSNELLVDYHGVQGIVRKGGWMDAGFLGLLVDGGDFLICPPLTTNTQPFTCPATGTAGTPHRDAYSTDTAPRAPHANPGSRVNWYVTNSLVQPHVQDFGPIDFNNPSLQTFYPESAKANNSAGGHENVFVDLRSTFYNTYKDASGRINYKGYVNRHGAVVTGCTAVSLDCIPFSVEGALGQLYSAHPSTSATAFYDTDHDVMSPVTGKSLIVYPN